jgi:hypothetical protein
MSEVHSPVAGVSLPAVLAKAAASLDVLSDGRFELNSGEVVPLLRDSTLDRGEPPDG